MIWYVGCVSRCQVLGTCAQVLSVRGITVTITVNFVISANEFCICMNECLQCFCDWVAGKVRDLQYKIKFSLQCCQRFSFEKLVENTASALEK